MEQTFTDHRVIGIVLDGELLPLIAPSESQDAVDWTQM